MIVEKFKKEILNARTIDLLLTLNEVCYRGKFSPQYRIQERMADAGLKHGHKRVPNQFPKITNFQYIIKTSHSVVIYR